MAMGKKTEQQDERFFAAAALSSGLGHGFYDKLDAVPAQHGFGRFAEGLCQEFYAQVMGRPGLAPGVRIKVTRMRERQPKCMQPL